jgi:ankyrin repeat protein
LILLALLLAAPARADTPWEAGELDWLIAPEAPPRPDARVLQPPEAFERIAADGNFVDPVLARGAAAQLLDAVRRQDGETVKRLLGTGVSPNGADYWGESPLIAAVRLGSTESVQQLLDAGADTEAVWRGYTPLGLAVSQGNALLTQLLLRAGANPNRANTDGDTPLHAAIRKGHLDTVRVLARARPDFVFYDRDGRTPLGLTVVLGRAEMARLLLDAGAPVEAGDRYAHSPLWIATTFNQLEIAEMLRARGARLLDASSGAVQ